MAKQPSTQDNNRSAISGRFVTEQYAKTHPNTTVTERGPAPPKSPSSNGKKK